MRRIDAGSTRAQALAAVRGAFRQARLPTPEIDARFLIRAFAGDSDVIRDDHARMLCDVTERRLKGEPIDRIIGDAEFWSLRFLLNGDTLSPRADTESLVELALELKPDRAVPLRILDIGTGTGAILIALLSERLFASGIGLDISESALGIARGNSRLNHVDDRSLFIAGNWTAALAGPFDLVVSNPPYIPSPEIAKLHVEVRDHDPLRALDGGEDGLEGYRALSGDLPRLLAPAGVAIVEIGEGQQTDVAALMESAGLRAGATKRDLGGHTRALAFHRDV